MKKNILIVQSLLILPLIISSSALSMQKQIMSDEEIEELQPAIRKNHLSVFAQLKNNFTNKPTHTKSIPEPNNTSSKSTTPKIEEFVMSTVYLTLPRTETIRIALPETTKVPTNTPEMPNALLESVILPTETKELSYFEQLNYYTSTANQLLSRMIYNLETDQFDTTNLTHFEWLYEAIRTATANKDFESLTKIATLCHTKYATTIRIPEHVAKPAAEFLHTHYSLEITLANQKLQDKHQEQIKQWNIETAACVKAINDIVNGYNQSVKKITYNYDTSVTQETEHVKDLRKDTSIFSLLNKEIRQETVNLLKHNPIQPPQNIFVRTMEESQKRLNNLTTAINEMPTINNFKSKSDNLALLQNK